MPLPSRPQAKFATNSAELCGGCDGAIPWFRSNLRRATASSAATVIPWPYTGLKLAIESPSANKPAGKVFSRA